MAKSLPTAEGLLKLGFLRRRDLLQRGWSEGQVSGQTTEYNDTNGARGLVHIKVGKECYYPPEQPRLRKMPSLFDKPAPTLEERVERLEKALLKRA